MAKQMMVFDAEEIIAMLKSHLQVAGYITGSEDQVWERGVNALEMIETDSIEIAIEILGFNPPPPKAIPLTREDAAAFLKPPPNPS